VQIPLASFHRRCGGSATPGRQNKQRPLSFLSVRRKLPLFFLFLAINARRQDRTTFPPPLLLFSPSIAILFPGSLVSHGAERPPFFFFPVEVEGRLLAWREPSNSIMGSIRGTIFSLLFSLPFLARKMGKDPFPYPSTRLVLNNHSAVMEGAIWTSPFSRKERNASPLLHRKT